MIQLPLSSTPIERAEAPSIMLGIDPDRDREIEVVNTLIENCATVGIPAVKYNMNLIGIPRSEREPGRGGSSNSTLRFDKIADDDAPGIAGEVSEDEFWERIDYFLERVVPVATENKVRLACHPHDPYTPPGFRGVTRVLGTPDGLKKFVDMHESPYHGLNFCQGTVTEMLDDPGEEIFDIIRYFGSREKIFNVHFRNIRGHKLDFMEVFPDEGSINMFECIKVYQEVGYKYMLMPDHVPHIAGAIPKEQRSHSCTATSPRCCRRSVNRASSLGSPKDHDEVQRLSLPLYGACSPAFSAGKRGTRQAKRDAGGSYAQTCL